MQQKNSEAKNSNVFSMSDQNLLIEFAQVLVEDLKEELHKENDSFENYAKQLRLRIQGDKTFPDRFVHGYLILVENCKTSR